MRTVSDKSTRHGNARTLSIRHCADDSEEIECSPDMEKGTQRGKE